MKTNKILAVSSGGGHWIQLKRLLPALQSREVCYLSVGEAPPEAVEGARYHRVRDANRWNPLALLVLAFQVFLILVRERPRIVLSTGAAPGLLSVVLGKLLGAGTIWVDSIANVRRLSLCGRLARPFADVYLTQWPHLARPPVLLYRGAVL